MNDDILDRITQRTGQDHPSPHPCFKLGKGQSKYPSFIHIVLTNDQMTQSFVYSGLDSTIHKYNEYIRLFFVSATITIYGKHLDELYQYLTERKVSHIQPAPQPIPVNAYDDETALITRIDVTYNKPQIEKDIETT
ncbi:hypothetical protein [Aquimarina macrocephali]|uniref:hypothetical protein n=1 Tax=Aquimarina macrocephali TaxID=666563 RepID=UPI001268ADB3|nr:hypothetical protein [Aquimarina macrocephali]